MDNRIALPALAVAGLLGVAGFGYGAYQAGVSQAGVSQAGMSQAGTSPNTPRAEPAATATGPAQAAATVAVQPPAPQPAPAVPVATPAAPPVPVVPRPAVAQVTHVEPIIARWQEPRQVCEMVTVQHQAPVKDEARVTGTLLGAAIGGVVGHQFGGGRGKDAATVAGAIAGGYAGNRVQGQRQQASTYTTTEQQCHTVMDSKTRTDGYLVSWQLGNQQGTLRTPDRPGATLPVRDGVVRAE